MEWWAHIFRRLIFSACANDCEQTGSLFLGRAPCSPSGAVCLVTLNSLYSSLLVYIDELRDSFVYIYIYINIQFFSGYTRLRWCVSLGWLRDPHFAFQFPEKIIYKETNKLLNVSPVPWVIFPFCYPPRRRNWTWRLCASRHVKIRLFLDAIQSNNRDSSTSHHHSAYGSLLFIAFSGLFILFFPPLVFYMWRIGGDRDVDTRKISHKVQVVVSLSPPPRPSTKTKNLSAFSPAEFSVSCFCILFALASLNRIQSTRTHWHGAERERLQA